MYFVKVLQRILNNFYLRNLAAWFIYISPDLLQDLADIKRLGGMYIFKDISGLTAFFIFFVFHSRVLYEKLFLQKKYISYAIAFLVTIFIWRESTSYLIWLASKPPTETVYHIVELKDYNWLFWLFIYWADVVYIGIALGVYLAFKYYKERTRLLQIENMQKEMELKQLNEQLNPHFLFNALNNIYSHILKNSGNGKELVLKLGELMRYVVDSSKKRTVSLTEEIAFIENYIAFEQERLGKRCDIHYTKSISAEMSIVPLILFSFIENAFKHGTASMQKSDIYISISTSPGALHMTVSNPVFTNEQHSTKTGLENVKKRLSLLYPDAYHLDIQQDEKTYTVKLDIHNHP